MKMNRPWNITKITMKTVILFRTSKISRTPSAKQLFRRRKSYIREIFSRFESYPVTAYALRRRICLTHTYDMPTSGGQGSIGDRKVHRQSNVLPMSLNHRWNILQKIFRYYSLIVGLESTWKALAIVKMYWNPIHLLEMERTPNSQAMPRTGQRTATLHAIFLEKEKQQP